MNSGNQSGNSVVEAGQLLLGAFHAILTSALADEHHDRAMLAHLLSLPKLGALIEQAKVAHVESIYNARESLLAFISKGLADRFAELFSRIPATSEYRADAESIANRALRNLSLSYLLRANEERWAKVVHQQFQSANNMTDQLAALRMLVEAKQTATEELASHALTDFYDRWRDEPLVVNQ